MVNPKRIKISLQLSLPQFLTLASYVAGRVPFNEKLIKKLYSARVLNDVVDVRCNMGDLGFIAGAIESDIAMNMIRQLDYVGLSEMAELEKELWVPLQLFRTVQLM